MWKSTNIKQHISWIVILAVLLIQSWSVAATTTEKTSVTTAIETTAADNTTDATTVTEAPTTVASATTMSTTTPRPDAVIGSNCTGPTDNEWCNSTIGGEALCNNSLCACDQGHFPLGNTTCLPVSDLEPNVTATESTAVSKTLNVSWTVKDPVNALNLGYTIKATSVDDNTTVNCNQSAAVLSATCGGLKYGHEYNVRVDVKFESYSGNSFAKDSITPAKPGMLVANQNYSAPNVNLTWTASEGRVEKYEVMVLRTQDTSPISPIETNLPSAKVTGLLAGTVYYVFITAKSHSKDSYIRNDTIRTETEVPSKPGTVSASGRTQNSIHLNWSAPSHPNGDVMAYRVCYTYRVYNNSPSKDGACVNTTGNETDFNVKKLPASGAFYDFSVSTINDKYTSNETSQTTARTLFSAPGEVFNLTGEAGNSSITVHWSRPTSPNGDITQYKLQWNHGSNLCHVILRNTTVAPDENNLCNSTVASLITTNQENMEYIITGLRPYTAYNLTVTAYTSVGAGLVTTISTQTSISRPDKVHNVEVSNVTSTSVVVTWEMPTLNTGPVNYTAVLVDNVLPGEEEKGMCSIQGFDSTNCSMSGLEEFWKYRVYVIGETVAGVSERVFSDNFTTQPGTPGQVTNVSADLYIDESNRDNCNATVANLTWTEPKLLDRNGNITSYKLDIEGREWFTYIYNVPDPDPYRNTSQSYHSYRTGLTPSFQYTVTIIAIEASNIVGEEHIFNFETKVCAPPKWVEVGYGKIQESSTTSPGTVAVSLQSRLYTNTEQGDLIERGLVISNKKIQHQSLDNITTWHVSKKVDFSWPYKIHPTIIENGKEKINIVIGGGSCAGTNNDCNGPLTEGLQIWVVAYACTSGTLCTFSPPYGPFAAYRTPKSVDDNNTGLIAGICILIVLLVAARAFVLLWYRGIIDPKSWFGRVPGGGGGGGDDGPFTPIMAIQKYRPMSLECFSERLVNLHKDTNLLLSDQYDDIKKLSAQVEENTTTDAANLEPNKPKNRWVNILPYDHSRVKLQQIDDDDPTSDYVNANYIPGFNKTREYIATQGPLPGTIDDFWRMVWEHQVMVIVMLTQCKEGSRVKCEMYWPDVVREAKQYGEVVVNPISISQLDKYNINLFELSVDGQTRQVFHFHYLDFPDFSANVEFDHFINFVRTVRSHVPHNMTGPMVIHCSAGVGRTGTYIATDRLNNYLNSDQFSYKDKVDIFNIVLSMRESRVLMVQTESQYIMIHDCFEKMLEDKKKSMETTQSMEDLYANQAYDPYPEVQYENLTFGNQMKTEL